MPHGNFSQHPQRLQTQLSSSLRKRVLAGGILIVLLLTQIWVIPTHAFLGFGSFGIKDEKELGRKFEVLVRF